MKTSTLVTLPFLILISSVCFGQTQTDSSYVQPHDTKHSVTFFVARKALDLNYQGIRLSPNSPLNLGFGYYVKNTILNFEVSIPVVKLASNNTYGKTSVIDLQSHQYGKHFVIDAYYQRYKGFYEDNPGGTPKALYPDLTVLRIGAEVNYLFNSKHLSTKAAFQQKERQLHSAGGFVIGGGIYHTQVKNVNEIADLDENDISNVHIGLGAGYAYTWVISPYWQLSGMATAGVSASNQWSEFRHARVKFFPRGFGRSALSYTRLRWGMYLSTIVQNDKVYATTHESLELAALNFQLAYIRHF